MSNNFMGDYTKRIRSLYEANKIGDIAVGRIDMQSVNFDWFYGKERRGIDPWLQDYKGHPDDYEPEYLLIGDWKEERGKYVEDPDGKEGFSAEYIYDKLEFIIYRSKWYSIGYHCSPVAPGCVDLDAPGALKGYCLPPEAIVKKDIFYNVRTIESP